MICTSSFLRVGLGIGCALALASFPARADITINEHISVEGAGMLKMANMAGNVTTTISGNRSRVENDLQMQSKFVRMLARGIGPTADITNLDQGKIYQLDLKKKQYRELSFDELKAQMQKAMADSEQAQQQATPMPLNEEDCEWSEPRTEVRKTGETAVYGGNQAQRLSIIASQACTHKKTGEVCEINLLLDQWLAPSFAAGEEARKFQLAYAQKLGLEGVLSRDVGERAEAMFGRYKGVWSEIAKQTKNAKGYPVRNTFAFGIGGPQCQSAQQASSETSQGNTNTSPVAIAGQLGNQIGGMFRRKKEDQPAQPAAAAAPTPASVFPAGIVPLITINSELVSATPSAAPGAFDVPADFKKVANQG